MTRTPMRDRDERGAAVVWVLGCGAVLFAIALVIVLRSLAVLARHRVESAADFAALAAATRIGIGGDPCAAAHRLALRNQASLQRCSLSLDPGGRSGTVAVQVRAHVDLPVVGERAVTATARAGRLRAPTDLPVPPCGQNAPRSQARPTVPSVEEQPCVTLQTDKERRHAVRQQQARAARRIVTVRSDGVWHAGSVRNRLNSSEFGLDRRQRWHTRGALGIQARE